MTADNPYQSPINLDLPELASAELPPEDRFGRGPAVMAAVGLLMGSAAIGIAGAVGAALLSATRLLDARHVMAHEAEFVFACSLFGGFLGLIGGGALGAVAGLWAGFCRARVRGKLVGIVSLMSGLFGGAVGIFGGWVISYGMNQHLHIGETLWPIVGGLIGTATGLAGGWVLGHVMAAFCWGEKR